ncbi:MAG: serine hydrolase [Patescibacteria group bacterium]
MTEKEAKLTKPYLILSFLALLLGTLSFLTGHYIGTKKVTCQEKSNPGKTVREKENGFIYINPLLECELSEEQNQKELKSFRAELNDLVNKTLTQQKAKHISIYYRDLKNGPWIGINEKEEFNPASLSKVPVMLSYLLLGQEDKAILSKKILFEEETKETSVQFFKTDGTLEAGKDYSVDQLLVKMIADSDNNATNLLVNNLTVEQILRPYKNLGIPPPDLQSDYKIRIKDYATFFRVLYNASYLNKEFSEKALGLLAQSNFDFGLEGGVKEGLKVSHKFGERILKNPDTNQLHDCGIVYHPTHPYLICVMTRGNDFSALAEIIKDISKFVFENIDTQSN